MNHILIVRLSALGDVAIMAPLVVDYAAHNPSIRFTVAGPPLLQPLFEGMPNVEYLGVRKKQNFVKICRILDAVGADTVIDLHKVNRVACALSLLRLRHLFAPNFHIYSIRKGRIARWLYLHHLKSTPPRPQIDRYDEVFSRAGFLPLDADIRHLYAQVDTTADGVTIGIAPFAQHKGKIWPAHLMRQLIAMLAPQGFRILLFGSSDEAPLLQQWALPYDNVVSVAGRQSFREELDIIKSLTLMVSMDSANMHFASAVGTPVVSIWGATHPHSGFYGYRQDPANALCANLPCQPCSAYGQRRCRYGDYRCLLAITPDMVFEKIMQTINPSHATNRP